MEIFGEHFNPFQNVVEINIYHILFINFTDRSWARRFRGTGKKRPDLLSADFSADRERANSPSPVVETKSIVSTAASTPEEESKPKYNKYKNKLCYVKNK